MLKCPSQPKHPLATDNLANCCLARGQHCQFCTHEVQRGDLQRSEYAVLATKRPVICCVHEAIGTGERQTGAQQRIHIERGIRRRLRIAEVAVRR